MRTSHGALAMVVALGLLAGCSSTAADKSGTPAVLTLTVGYADAGPNTNGQSAAGPVFMAELRRLFGDRLDLVEKSGLGVGKTAGDAVTVRAIASGEVDAGWVAVRALSDAGIRGFDALTAPMLLTSHAAQAEVVQGETAQAFLDQLEGSGVTGLSLAVGGLRRPVSSTEPLLGPQDWTGRDVAVLAESQKSAVRDLRATPITLSGSVQTAFQDGVTATELDMGTYDANLLAQQVPYVTANVVLWPKMWLLVVNTERFGALSPADQQLVRDAAIVATQASVDESHDETTLALKECAAGARFPSASATDVAALRAAFAPTLERLAADPVDGPLLAKVQSIAARHPMADVVAVPERCTGKAPPSLVVDAIPTTKSDIPPGTYRMTLTEQDLLDNGVQPDRARDNDLVITMVITADGTYRVIGDDIGSSSAAFANLLWEVGTLTGVGSTAYFVPDIEEQRRLKAQGVNAAVDEPGNNLQTTPAAMTWSFDDGQLTFSEVIGISDPIGILWSTAHPYKKID